MKMKKVHLPCFYRTCNTCPLIWRSYNMKMEPFPTLCIHVCKFFHPFEEKVKTEQQFDINKERTERRSPEVRQEA